MNKRDIPPGLMTARQIARFFKVSIKTVRAWTRDERIPSIRLNERTVRYSFDAVYRAAINDPRRRPRTEEHRARPV